MYDSYFNHLILEVEQVLKIIIYLCLHYVEVEALFAVHKKIIKHKLTDEKGNDTLKDKDELENEG